MSDEIKIHGELLTKGQFTGQLFQRQRTNSFGNLHCSRQLSVSKCIAPLTYGCRVQEERTTKRMTPGLSALVACVRLWCSQSSRDRNSGDRATFIFFY